MAGIWHLSHHQFRDPLANGRVYANAKAYFTSAETSLPIVVYQDYGLGTAHPNPVQANGYGVFPPVFLDEEDEFYRQRITTSAGVLIPGTDVGTLPIIGPSGGGGGSEVPVDENALLKTGDVIWLDQSGARAGFVRDNGRSIGSATSGASERANADCEALYLFLYATYSDTVCPVTGGRGANAAADWAANKPIGLPDKRGYVPGGLDDMGNTAASRFTGVPIIQGSVTTAGSLIGETSHTLTTPEIAAHTHVANVTDPGHKHTVAEGVTPAAGGREFVVAADNVVGTASNVLGTSTTGITVANDNAGGGGSHNTTQRTVLGTYYRKL